jgi:dihydrofolate reductase
MSYDRILNLELFRINRGGWWTIIGENDMRKIIVINRITLDGVLHAPSAPSEDPSDNFPFGGWAAPFSDEVLGKSFREQMSDPRDLLLGRKTFDIFASY